MSGKQKTDSFLPLFESVLSKTKDSQPYADDLSSQETKNPGSLSYYPVSALSSGLEGADDGKNIMKSKTRRPENKKREAESHKRDYESENASTTSSGGGEFIDMSGTVSGDSENRESSSRLELSKASSNNSKKPEKYKKKWWIFWNLGFLLEHRYIHKWIGKVWLKLNEFWTNQPVLKLYLINGNYQTVLFYKR